MPESRTAVITTGRRLLRRRGRRLKSAGWLRKLLAYLAILGPGMIAASAGNDAGGIATFAAVGAEQGYRLLWILIPITIRPGLVSGNVRAHGRGHGQRTCRSDSRTLWRALDRLHHAGTPDRKCRRDRVGVCRYCGGHGVVWRAALSVRSAFRSWHLVARRQEFISTCGTSLSADVAGLPWLHRLGVSCETRLERCCSRVSKPSFSLEYAYLFTFVAIVGTTISPYMQVYIQSSVVEKGVTPDDYRRTKMDVWVGTILAILVVFFIVVSTAATLHQSGVHIESAADAARALQPFAGPYAEKLFAIGLFGASMLAAGVLPLATAYSISEALGFEKGVSRSFREAPIFIGVFTFLIAVGAAIAVIPGLPLIRVLLVTQVINGLLLPIILFTILKLVNDREVMGDYVNSRLYNFGASNRYHVTLLSGVFIIVTLSRYW